MTVILNRRQAQGAFTLVELVIVILLVAVLAALALPRFLAATDEARDASAVAGLGGFVSAIQQASGEWRVEGRPATQDLNGLVTSVSPGGFPLPSAPGIQGCVDLWEAIHLNATPLNGFVGGSAQPGWSALRFGVTGCLYVYQFGQIFTVDNQLPFFIYLPAANQFNLVTFNWPA